VAQQPVVPPSAALNGVNALGGANGMPGMDMSGGKSAKDDPGQMDMHGKHGKMDMAHMEVPHPGTPDRARAAAILQAGMQFSNVRYDQTNPGTDPSGTHRRLTPAQVAAYKAAAPGMPVPTSIVFDKPGGTAVGLMFLGDKQAGPNLGMERSHRHHEGARYMAHVWFTPGNLDLAYSGFQETGRAKAEARKH
jgi:hypothetical protein